MNRKRAYILACFSVAAIYILSAFFVNYRSTGFKNVLHADAAGYYLWLPATLIYGDKDLRFTDTVFTEYASYPKGAFTGTIVPVSNGDTMNKYSMGVAICELPFFMVAHSYGKIVGETRGYELHYQLFWLIGSVCYVVLGLAFLFLLAYRSNQHFVVPLVLTGAMLFGTNLFHYTTFDAGYSHAFTFAVMSALLFFAHRLAVNKGGTRGLIMLAALAGLLVLIRPFNIALLFALLLYVKTPQNWWQIFRSNWRATLISITVFLSFIFVHFLGNYWQTGAFFIYGYGSEKFDFSHPHWWEFLFGFQIGAFVYSPLFLVILVSGLAALVLQRSWYRALIFLTSFVAISWVLSCWGTWTFGCTLGNRPLTDFYAWSMFPLLTFQYSRSKLVYATGFLVAVVGIFYSQILHFQYRNFILDWCNMDAQKFSDVFMKTDPRYAYFTADDWDFSRALNSRTIKDYHSRATRKMRDNEPNKLLEMDSLVLDSNKKYRILFQCEAKFTGEVGESVLAVYMNTGSGYHDLLHKMWRKHVREPDVWGHFRFEFYLKPTDELLSVVFSVHDVDSDDLQVRNIRAAFIEYE